MSKLPITILILVILSLFATADLYLNKVELKTQTTTPVIPVAENTKVESPRLNNIVKFNQLLQSYEVSEQAEVRQLFEKINLSEIKNIDIYKNQLSKDIASDNNTSKEIIYLYEIVGPKGQGNLTYLNVKLQFIAQINNQNETINENNGFGNNSFFFNDNDYQNTGFLMVQIADHLYGFQYSKEKPEIYENIKAIINELTLATTLAK